ncbi:hypothetical protein COCSADRAFT_173644 [Bipolaris sorokiniana ND90Pr]|uniref:Uncharacterized protein n=1 Tax=Cochliobolus sativus (strain ND90Pr / ATCC 201652) TaxID=665912 RepID=M2R213_COCSN|nr:uncharacterized protein COCSADRAFT_173644 [Bipolaris sorokiniana ND90Pr]EMD61294.1 hypothetical protein COCSADRAFT_173644 [Bipolaris sorokiniana ND90Pr]
MAAQAQLKSALHSCFRQVHTDMCMRIRLKAPEVENNELPIDTPQPKQPREKAACISDTKTSHATLCGGDTLPTRARVVTRGY